MGSPDLLLDQVEIVEQPFGRRRYPAIVPGRRGQQLAGIDQDRFVVVQARQQEIPRAGRGDPVGSRERPAMALHLVGAEQFRAQCRLVAQSPVQVRPAAKPGAPTREIEPFGPATHRPGASRSVLIGIAHAMRHVAGRDMEARVLHVVLRIVEEDVGAEGFEERPLSRPPRNKASSRRTPHSRRVRITRLCAGAERAVTSAVRIGESSGRKCRLQARAAPRGSRGTDRRSAVRARARSRARGKRPGRLPGTRARTRRRRSPRRHRMRCAAGHAPAWPPWPAGWSPRRRRAASASRTDSGLADRNNWAPNGWM